MSDMPERIYANDASHWHPFPGEEGTVEYVRADLYANELSQLAIESKNRELALAKRIQFLEKALVQAIACGNLALPTNQEAVSHGLVCTMDDTHRLMCAVELNRYLQEVRE